MQANVTAVKSGAQLAPVEMPKSYPGIVNLLFGQEASSIKAGDHAQNLRARFPDISNENIVKLESLLLGQRSVVLDSHEKKTFAKIHHDVCLYELKHFMIQTSKLCLKLEEKDPTFKDKCSVFVSVASDEAPDHQKGIMAAYALLKFLTDYQIPVSETALSKTKVVKSAFTKGLVGYNFAKFLIDNVENQIEVQKVPKEQIAENLIETAKIFKAVATDAKVKSEGALESGDLFLLVSNTITQLTFVLKFAICTSGWMDDFLKILMKVEDVAYFATLKGQPLLTELLKVKEENRTKTYADKILSFYCYKNNLPKVAPSLNDMKLILNTWTK